MVAGSHLAFIFPGQGSQAAGMGKELAATFPIAQETFNEADEALGYKLSKLCFEGPEAKLRLTEITQPAILTVSIAAFRVLQQRGIAPRIVAGHSLGEYSAHVAAGTFKFGDAVRTVRNRGKYMQEAVPPGEGAMAAILGLDAEAVAQLCRDAAQNQVVSPANINSPEQVVISGDAAAVNRAMELAKARGAKRAVLLPVSAPFHCALMQPAQERLAGDLQALALGQAGIPVARNVDGALCLPGPGSPSEARTALTAQVTAAVEWVKCVQTLISSGVTAFVEVGPGKVLCGLLRQIDRSQNCLNVADHVSLLKTVSLLQENLG